ncbi:MAG: aldo/keto reductase [Gammaproteobacteria bacterium RIFCSPHIGHO2_12_FULL_37_34]|nr:MAG: aldo/keto reductase [Gammaproteobacteria bacterium RIFCSPHIGHO2_12_FULL_37_34]
MQKRCLGQSGIEVSVIGLGTVKFGRNEGVTYPAAFQLPTDQVLECLLHEAYDLGVNLIDTAPAYGISEERIGKLLQGRRLDWVISTKVGEAFHDGVSQFDFSEQGIVHSVERSLQRLQTDYLDVVLVHSNGDDVRLIEQEHVFVTLSKLKKSGKIRVFGMSTKTIAGGLLTVKHADVAMVTYNLLHLEEQKIIREANQQQKGIFVKKGLVSGHLQHIHSQHPVKDSLQFILAEPGVSSVIIGSINPLHVRENVNCNLA